MRLASFLLLSSLALPSYAITCGYPADTADPNQGLVLSSGYGYDMDRARIKPAICVNPLNDTIQSVGTPTASYNAVVSRSLGEYVQSVSNSYGGGLKIFGFGGSASHSVTKAFTQKNYSSTFSLEYRAYLGNDVFVVDGNNPLSKTALDASADYCNFKRVCGTHFVYQSQKGALVTMAFRFVFDSSDTKTGFDNNFGLNVDTNIANVPISFNLSHAVGNSTSAVLQHSQVEVYMYQEGGDVAALGKALGVSNGSSDAPIATCRLDNLAACDSAIGNAINYLASDTFINGIKTQPAILNQALRPFWELEPHLYALSESEVTPAITTARNNLVNAYLQRSADLSTAQQLLNGPLTNAHRTSLQRLVSSLNTEIDSLRNAALICYSDLSQCEAKTSQLLSTLMVYDSNLLSYQSSDGLVNGLVAYYPFDSTALDASGNGNNGTVYGASLTTDRNGKVNSAYSFNGNAAYINTSGEGTMYPYMTISAWVYPTDLNGKRMIIGRASGSTCTAPQYALNVENGQTLFWIKRNGSWFATGSGTLLNTNQWALLTATWDGQVTNLYLNGKLVGTRADIPAGGIDNPHLGSTAISYWCYRDPQFFVGTLDDIRIYNRALTNAEITQLSQVTDSQLSPPQPPTAIFTSSSSQNGSMVNVDASLSNTTNGTIQRYDWSSSDGQVKSGKTASFNFSASGNYSITLTVTDSNGLTSQAVKNITISLPSTSVTIARLINLSANAKLPIIGGLGISGTGTLRLMFRGFAIDSCVDPIIILQKYPSGEEVARNNDWQIGGSIAGSIQNLPSHLTLTNPKDAGLLIDLPVGYYTISLGSNGCNGQGLIGVDLIESASSPTAKLINLSANAPVPIIGGLGMSGSGNMKAMFRGFQVDPCVDANLVIQKYPSGEFFASNNDWWTDSDSAQVAALPSYLQLPKSSDAGLLRDLTPQYFTATLSSNTACSGNGLFGLDMVQ